MNYIRLMAIVAMIGMLSACTTLQQDCEQAYYSGSTKYQSVNACVQGELEAQRQASNDMMEAANQLNQLQQGSKTKTANCLVTPIGSGLTRVDCN